MPSMPRRAIRSFLGRANLARIATLKHDGSPFVVPVWYEWDGSHLYFLATATASWVENIRGDARVAVVIDNDDPPHEKVIIEGEAEIVGEAVEDWIRIGKRMVKRYMKPDSREAYIEEIKRQRIAMIRVTPRKLISWVVPEP